MEWTVVHTKNTSNSFACLQSICKGYKMTVCGLTCTCWMTPWPLAIWLTRSTRATCSHPVPCVTGVSDSAPKSGAGVVSLSIWQGPRDTTVHSYIVDRETWNSMTWCRQSQTAYGDFSEIYTYTLSRCLWLLCDLQRNDKVEKNGTILNGLKFWAQTLSSSSLSPRCMQCSAGYARLLFNIFLKEGKGDISPFVW